MDHHQHHQQHQNPHQHQPPHQHQQQSHHQYRHQQHQPMYPTNSSYPPQPQMIPLHSTPTNTNSNSTPRFPFPQNAQAPLKQQADQITTSPYSGSGGFSGMDPNNSAKKKRGRPRKYSPDSGGSNIALGLAPTPAPSSAVVVSSAGQADSGGVTPSSDNPSKKNRGRPPGSSKKQLDALGNCGVGFTPHVILVNAGEDIASKIVAFSKEGPRTVCVLSANGSICNVDLRQPAMNGGVVKYEGRYEIISLSGSFLFSENSGGQARSGGLSVSLAGSDGRVLGGGVVGVLRAASPVQIIVGSFIADGKKSKYMPSVPQSHMLSFAAPQVPAGDSPPPSQEVSTEGSDENGSSHIDRNMGSYGHSNHPMHHNMQMYSQMGWPNSAPKMLQN